MLMINKNIMNERCIFLFKIRMLLDSAAILILIIVTSGLESCFWGCHIKRRTVFLVKRSSSEYKNYVSAINSMSVEMRDRGLI
jgi:hypothetical protein